MTGPEKRNPAEKRVDPTLGVELPPLPGVPSEETWIERERRVRAERDAELARRRAAAEHGFEAWNARTRARGCDDGSGVCLYCGVQLGRDLSGAATHPDNGCTGPPRTCDVCGKPYQQTVGKREQPTCTPEEHARLSGQRSPSAFNTVRELSRPTRVNRDDD